MTGIIILLLVFAVFLIISGNMLIKILQFPNDYSASTITQWLITFMLSGIAIGALIALFVGEILKGCGNA